MSLRQTGLKCGIITRKTHLAGAWQILVHSVLQGLLRLMADLLVLGVALSGHVLVLLLLLSLELVAVALDGAHLVRRGVTSRYAAKVGSGICLRKAGHVGCLVGAGSKSGTVTLLLKRDGCNIVGLVMLLAGAEHAGLSVAILSSVSALVLAEAGGVAGSIMHAALSHALVHLLCRAVDEVQVVVDLAANLLDAL